MTTPVIITGFEYGLDPVTSGGGLVGGKTGTPVIESTIKHTGNHCLRCSMSAEADYVNWTLPAGTQVVVARTYVRWEILPSGAICRVMTGAQAVGGAFIGVNASGYWIAGIGGGSTVTLGTGPSTGTWYCIDARMTSNADPNTLDWKIDGVAQTQATGATAAQDITIFRLGSTVATTADMYLDDLVVSFTSADFPIGEGGTERIQPSSDGTHSNPSNYLTNQAGTPIDGSLVLGYGLINSRPPSSTTYIQQLTIATGDYIEVLLSELGSTHSAIIGAQAFLAYTSATTTTNSGGAIVTKDNFATSTTVWGAPGALADYSDGATTNLYYKSAIVDGVVSDATVSALKARLGYSGDATPDPYWIDLWVEVAYSTSTSNAYSDDAAVGSYAATGVEPTLQRTYQHVPDVGSYAVTGVAPTLAKGYRLDCVVGSYATTGVNPTLQRTYQLALVAGTYAHTGIDPTLQRTYQLALVTGSYAVAGVDPTLTVQQSQNYILDTVAGSYSIAGIPVTNPHLYQLTSVVGSYSLAGIASAFNRTYQCLPVVGSLTLTGIAATLQRTYQLPAVVGSYSLAGIASLLAKGYLVVPVVGTYSTAGVTASLLYNRMLAAVLGTYASTGLQLILQASYYFLPAVGSYNHNGVGVVLTYEQLAYIRPSADSYVGLWTDQDGGSTNLYATVNETIPNDATYVKSPSNPALAPVVFALSDMADPGQHISHALSYRYGKMPANATQLVGLVVQLRQGYTGEGTPGTLIAEWTHNNVPVSLATADQTLTELQASNITDYSDLFVRMVAEVEG